MGTKPLEAAIASTRGVLANVDAGHLHGSTPCAKWDVSALINHMSVHNGSSRRGPAARLPTVPSTTTPRATTWLRSTRRRPTALLRSASPASWRRHSRCRSVRCRAFVGLATTDTFAHGWDLAKATGQDTDLDPELASQILAQSRQAITPAFRSEEGAVFGLERTAPEGASNADQLAAFLGRTV